MLPKGLQNMTLLKAEASSFNKPGCLVLGDVIPRLETNLSRALLIGYVALIATDHITQGTKPQIWISQCMDQWRASIQVPRQKAITIYPPPDRL